MWAHQDLNLGQTDYEFHPGAVFACGQLIVSLLFNAIQSKMGENDNPAEERTAV
ncbi:hypothetical protein ACFL54_01105 [Planctomycetota bacterium]